MKMENMATGKNEQNRSPYAEAGYGGSAPPMERMRTPVYYYLRVLRKQLALILACMGAAVVIIVILVMSGGKSYKATGQLLFSVPPPMSDQTTLLGPADYSGLGQPEWGAYMPTQLELLKGRSLAKAVAEKLSFSNKWEFEPGEPGLLSRVFLTVQSWTSQSVETTKAGATSDAGTINYVDAIVNRLDVKQLEDSRVVEISFTGKDPERVVKILNLLMETFIKQDFERRYRSAHEVVGWLRGQQRELQTAIEKYESQLQVYVEKEDLAVAPDSNGECDTVDVQKLAALSQSIIAAKARRIESQVLYEQLSRKDAFQDSVPRGMEGDVLRKLRSERATLTSQKRALAETYGEKWPEMQEISAKLAGVDTEIAAERQRVLAATKTAYEVAKQQEERLTAALEEQKRHTIALKRKGLYYKGLKREIDANEKMFDMLLDSSKAAGIAEKIDRSQVSVVAPAHLVPASNSRAAMLVGILFLGGLAAVGIAFFREQGNPRIETEDEVEDLLHLPLLGSIHRLDGQTTGRNGSVPPLVTQLEPHSISSEQFQGLSANAMAQFFERNHKTLLITSTIPREGKTLVAANLAACIAQFGKKVLLIDTDTRAASIHKVFSLENDTGFVDMIRQEELELSAAIRPSGIAGLSIITAGRSKDDDQPFSIRVDRVRALLSEAAETFDAILLDTAPLGVVADAMKLSAAIDVALFVVRSRAITKMMAERSVGQLNSAGIELVGAVLNDVHQRRIGARYYYYPYRHAGYQDYYSGDRKVESEVKPDAHDGEEAHSVEQRGQEE